MLASTAARPIVSLAELVGAFSYALDLTEGQPPGHCVRACWIGSHVGRELELDASRRSDLYYTIRGSSPCAIFTTR